MNVKQDLIDQIKHRYAIFDRPRNGSTNVIIDSFMPSYYLKSIKYGKPIESFPTSFASISEFTADITSTPLVPREDLFRMLGYSLKDLNKLVHTVRSKKIDFVMLGLGGTNSNTLYWLYEILHLTNNSNLFKSLTIFEPDTLSIDNLLRMPMSAIRENNTTVEYLEPRYNIQLSPANISFYLLTGCSYMPILRDYNNTLIKDAINQYLNGVEDITKNNTCNVLREPATVSKLTLIDKKYQKLCSNTIKACQQYFKPSRYHYYNRISCKYIHFENYSNKIFYGAPDIATRQAMSEANLKLITATHGDDDASLILNPVNQSDLQVESYGMIKLTTFFMNQIRLAIGLLELLASDQDLSERNKKILDFSYVTNTKTLPTSRQWNCQLEHNGLIRDDI
jgi:hypothetical protein